jgi:hypothetical protein
MLEEVIAALEIPDFRCLFLKKPSEPLVLETKLPKVVFI